MGCNAEEWITHIAAREEQLDRLTNEAVGWFTTASWMLVPKSASRSVRGQNSIVNSRDAQPYIMFGLIGGLVAR